MNRTLLPAIAIFLAFLAWPSAAKTLDTLLIEGLQINQPSVVRNSAGLRQGKDFAAADVQEAVRSLYRLGLFRTVDVYVMRETDSSAALLVRVQEYPVCEAVVFTGNKKIKTKDLEENLSLRSGRVATDSDIRDNIKTIKDQYDKAGYTLASVDYELVPAKVPGNATVKFRIREGQRVRIRKITFSGNVAFKERRLKRKLKTKEARLWNAGKYDVTLYREHLDSLLMYYQNQGYLDARVVRDSVWYAENKRDIHIDIQIEEGRRFYAGDVYFAGNKIIQTDSLKAKVALKHNKPFEKDKFDMTRYLVEDAYREEGYLWVQVRDERAYRGDTIDVTLNIVEGRAAIVRKIDISGNIKTRDKVIRRNIVLSPGQKYRQSLMARSVREIMQLNYFNNVTPDLKPNEDGTIDLVFKVEEKDNIGQLSIGAAYSQRDQFVGTFSTAIPNFRGNGQELSLNVEFGKYRQDYSIGFKEPWAFDRPISVSAQLYYNETRYAQYSNLSTQSYGFTVGAGRKLKWPDDYFRLDGLYKISKDEESRSTSYHSGFGSDSAIEVPHEGFMSRLSLTLYRNDTDVPTFPNRGSVFFLTPEIAGLGGDYKYLKATVGYDWYFPLFWKFVYGFKSKFGVVSRLPWSDRLVISRWDLYNAGGVYSDGIIRGYPDYTFGGRDNPSKGVTMLVLSSMIQFPVLERQLYLSIFGDMGNTWGSVAEVDPTDLNKGVGFGLRLLVPMLGLMGFDFAWRLDDPDRTPLNNNPGTGADRFEFHFLMNRGF
jgi:outer membrane protein insertion porin family